MNAYNRNYSKTMSTSKRTKLGFLQWLEKIKSVHYANVQAVDVAMDNIENKQKTEKILAQLRNIQI